VNGRADGFSSNRHFALGSRFEARGDQFAVDLLTEPLKRPWLVAVDEVPLPRQLQTIAQSGRAQTAGEQERVVVTDENL
jgi:hypothetical protein